ncbi:MAG: sulfatase-like hydrolase/transferase [Anaerolineae bacterium]
MLTQPNILFIQSDQHRFDCVGANGHPLLKTPHLDRLAQEGVNFTQAYTPIPVCGPSRNCLMYGQWSTQHLCIANDDTEAPRPARPGIPTWGPALRQRGYHLAHVGKWHVHPDHDPTHLDYGFHTYVSERGYAAWRGQVGLEPRPKLPWTGGVDPHIAPVQSRLAWSADQVLQLLEEAAHRGRPFFIRWNTSEPHLPNVVPEPYASMYDPEVIKPWTSFSDPLVGKPYIQAQQRRTWGVVDWTWGQWTEIVGRYLGEISLLDAQVGRLLDTLERLCLAESTVVIFTSDHGDLCGAHGMVDKHYVMYDDVVRVPLIVRWPGRIKPASVCDAFVSHSIDLATTVCEIAGVAVPETFQGQSLIPLFDGETDNGREDIFATYHGNQFGLYSERMVRDRRWKYVWNATAEDELYDLISDPGELHNLVRDAASAEVLARLRRRLVAWMEQTRDPLLNGWNRTQLLEGRSL